MRPSGLAWEDGMLKNTKDTRLGFEQFAEALEAFAAGDLDDGIMKALNDGQILVLRGCILASCVKKISCLMNFNDGNVDNCYLA
jgi:hypothetical protein